MEAEFIGLAIRQWDLQKKSKPNKEPSDVTVLAELLEFLAPEKQDNNIMLRAVLGTNVIVRRSVHITVSLSRPCFTSNCQYNQQGVFMFINLFSQY